MPLFHLIVLALVQGITEFLPVSSSAHLILVPHVTGWEDQGLLLDVAVHVGTLLAVMLYFWRDLWEMLRGAGLALRGKRTAGQRMIWHLIVATVPAIIAGYLLHKYAGDMLRSVEVIAWATIGFGLLLWWSDVVSRRIPQPRDEHSLNWKDILLIGCAQALALIPGTSRSGVTMTAGLLLGLSRSGAARFSFLLSIPVIVLASVLSTLDLVEGGVAVDWTAMGLGVVLSAVSAYLCIHIFLKLLERVGMLPFVIYRLILGVVLLVLFTGA